MSDAAIEIHDVGLRGRRDHPGGRAVEPAPGFALVDGDRIVTGAEARARHRLEPRRVHHRFWSELGTSPLPAPFPSDLSTADLAHAQLEALWARLGPGIDRVVIAVPGTWDTTRLGLLLSVCRAGGIPVDRMIDVAVAATAVAQIPGGRVVHVDVRLHGAVATELTVGDHVERGRVEAVPGAGMIAIRHAWARRAATEFVRQSRFDPLDRAEADQALADELDRVVPRLPEHDRTTLTIAALGRTVSADVARGDLVEATREPFDRIRVRVGAVAGNRTDRVLLSATAAALPGLAEALSRSLDVPCDVVDDDAPLRGALSAPSPPSPSVDGVALIRQVPRVVPREHEPPSRGLAPTHVAVDGILYAVPRGRSRLVSDGSAVRIVGERSGVPEGGVGVVCEPHRIVVEPGDSTVLVDGRSVDGPVDLRPGSRVRLGEHGPELLFLREADADGQA